MKVLFITAEFPFPMRRGMDIIACTQLEGLSKNHQVTLVSEAPESPDSLKASGLESLCARVLLADIGKRNSKVRALSQFLGGRSLQMALMENHQVRELAAKELTTGDYDVVYIMMSRIADCVDLNSDVPKVLHHVDPAFIKYRRSSIYEPGWKNVLLELESKRLENFDEQWAKKFSCHLFVSEDDAELYRDRFKVRAEQLPHTVDLTRFDPRPGIEREPGTVIVTGNMFYAPNVDGVIYFCKNVWGHVRQQFPSARLKLVGAKPPASIQKFHGKDQIEVTGFVDDLAAKMQQATVSVCPVRLRLGTQTKILEAMACRVPVVSTFEASVGITAEPGKEILVGHSDEEMAHLIVEVLQGDHQEIGEAGRRFVEAHHANQASWNKMESILNSVARPEPVLVQTDRLVS
ncbi:MAG: glycosyltransferase family 4 protein [Fimbriimonadaceae bacterium]